LAGPERGLLVSLLVSCGWSAPAELTTELTSNRPLDAATAGAGQIGQVGQFVAGEGASLWRYALGEGVDDVWAADLDAGAGDGRDEVIIGYNGGTGLHVLNADGTPRWKYESIGNVWHVTVAPTGAGGSPEVITTSAGGMVHVFDPAGKAVTTLRPGGYANLVRVASAGVTAAVIVTEQNNGQNLAGMDRSGNRLWKAPLPEGSADDGVAAPDKPWMAFASRDGSVIVIDVRDGSRLITTKAGGRMGGVAWLAASGDHPTLLVMASGAGIRALAIKETPPPEEQP
jgi:hypothetical protein